MLLPHIIGNSIICICYSISTVPPSPVEEPLTDEEPPLDGLLLPGVVADELPDVDGAVAFCPMTSRLKWVISVFT